MSKPWLAQYDAGVPATLAPYPSRTLLDVFRDNVRQAPQHPALIFMGRRMSGHEIDRLSDAFAAALVRLGIRPGDRVATLLPNCPQFLVAELGAWKAGAVLVPLNPLYGDDELEGPLASTEARLVVALTPFYERVKRVQPRTAVGRVIATNIKEYLPPRLRLLFTLFKERRDGHRCARRDGDPALADLLAHHADDAAPAVDLDPESPALILLSGGTTGTPKGVVGTHRALVITGLQIRSWYGTAVPDPNDVILLPLPLFHAFGCVAAQSLAFAGRHPLALVPNPRDLADLIASVRRLKPAFFVGVPSLFNALLNHPDVQAGRADFRSMKLCASGAAPLLLETKRRFESLTGGRILEGYSMTEAMIAATLNPLSGRGKPGSVGLPLPDVELRIVDAETGTRPLPAGEVGEVTLRAPQIMRGYWRDEAETRVALRADAEGSTWLHTGDLGYCDAEGWLFLVDRKKDLIKIGGLQVWPREIEEALAAHPAVAEVGVAGVPDADKGEVAKAWIVLRAGATASADELRAHCKARLAPFKVPAQVEFRAELPKSMVGKVLRRVLVQEQREAAAQRSAASR